MATDNVARLLETYEAFVAGELERIPEFSTRRASTARAVCFRG
jgi:hypothetical protein